jgi:hypothetical protein
MGVKDLWTILEPSAERVNLDALRGKTIAVDASIWMIQFFERLFLLSFLVQLPAAAYVATKYFDTRNDTTNFRVLGRRGNTKFRLFLGGGGKQNRRVRNDAFVLR